MDLRLTVVFVTLLVSVVVECNGAETGKAVTKANGCKFTRSDDVCKPRAGQCCKGLFCGKIHQKNASAPFVCCAPYRKDCSVPSDFPPGKAPIRCCDEGKYKCSTGGKCVENVCNIVDTETGCMLNGNECCNRLVCRNVKNRSGPRCCALDNGDCYIAAPALAADAAYSTLCCDEFECTNPKKGSSGKCVKKKSHP